MSFDSSDYASGLVRALREGPLSTPAATTAIPEGADLLAENPTTQVTPAGERVLRLDFSPTLRNYLAFSGLEEWQLRRLGRADGVFVRAGNRRRVHLDRRRAGRSLRRRAKGRFPSPTG